MLSNFEITGLKKFQGQPKYSLVQFACQRKFFETKQQNNIHSNNKPKAFSDEPPSANKNFLAHCHKDFALIG